MNDDITINVGGAVKTDLIAATRAAIDRVIEGGASRDDVLTTINVVDRLKQLTRELAAKSDAAVVAWLEQHGDIECGEVRYYAGVNKTTKCEDKSAAVGALLDATGGDVDKLSECLASDGLKPGMCRAVLGDKKFGALFVTKETADLKTGKPVKRVQKFDRRFQ